MARKSVLQGRQFKYIKGGMYTLNFFVWVSIMMCVYEAVIDLSYSESDFN